VSASTAGEPIDQAAIGTTLLTQLWHQCFQISISLMSWFKMAMMSYI
jgi:hypothetical protein